MSEKNRSIVTIKIVKRDKPFVGAVQKVLNQVIILRSPGAQHITLTLGDIESVNGPEASFATRVSTLYRSLSGVVRSLVA